MLNWNEFYETKYITNFRILLENQETKKNGGSWEGEEEREGEKPYVLILQIFPHKTNCYNGC